MSRRDRQIRICALLLVLNLLFIWGNSLLPAEISRLISNWVAQQIPDLTETTVNGGKIHILRKLAHFTEFTALGLLLSRMLALLQKKQGAALLLGIVAACIDETIQLFVPGRGPGLRDVAIDTCGVMAGMILLQLGYTIVKKLRNTSFGG